LINKYYVFDSDLAFTGKELLASINNQKQRHLQSQMDLKSTYYLIMLEYFGKNTGLRVKVLTLGFFMLQLKEVLH